MARQATELSGKGGEGVRKDSSVSLSVVSGGKIKIFAFFLASIRVRLEEIHI